MSKGNLILVAILIVGGLFVYRQYRFYRTPVAVSDSEVETSGETDGLKHSIPLDEIITGNPRKDGIPSIDDPVYESVWAADQYLNDDGIGLAVEVNGRHRYYPYQILVWHEIVNDTFAEKSLVVTYCPLCATGIVFDSVINGEVLEFGTSGKLYNSNLLMYDRKTDSYWSQALGEAVVGEFTGTELELYPSLTLYWKDFKKNYPNAEVLSRNTGFSRDYTRSPYPGYETNPTVWFPLGNKDPRLLTKEIVFGWDTGEAQKAWTESDVKKQGVINDVVGDLPVVIIYDTNLNTVRGFVRAIDDVILKFEQGDDFLIDDETGSLWNYSGEAVNGDYRGNRLEVLALENHFWFSWAATHPETELYGE